MEKRYCEWCGTGFVADQPLCGKCTEEQAANRTYHAQRGPTAAEYNSTAAGEFDPQ